MSAKTRAVDRSAWKGHMAKSDEHLEAMEACSSKGLWNACVVNAIHCAICAADAITVFYLGFRNAGERHSDVVGLLRETGIDSKELALKITQLTALLSIKNTAEYEERLMDEAEARNAMKACERFHSWAKSKVG